MTHPQRISASLRHWLILALAAAAAGCSDEEPPYRKPTFPVRGRVTVDGSVPSSPVQVLLHSVTGIDTEHPTYSQAETNREDGSFEVATYEAGDGVPQGDYTLTFIWQDFSLMSNSYSGPDKLNGRYSDAKASEFKVTVASEPVELGEIKLTTK